LPFDLTSAPHPGEIRQSIAASEHILEVHVFLDAVETRTAGTEEH
jgi:hypothetical protein